jgi:hypothetical protein
MITKKMIPVIENTEQHLAPMIQSFRGSEGELGLEEQCSCVTRPRRAVSLRQLSLHMTAQGAFAIRHLQHMPVQLIFAYNWRRLLSRARLFVNVCVDCFVVGPFGVVVASQVNRRAGKPIQSDYFCEHCAH